MSTEVLNDREPAEAGAQPDTEPDPQSDAQPEPQPGVAFPEVAYPAAVPPDAQSPDGLGNWLPDDADAQTRLNPVLRVLPWLVLMVITWIGAYYRFWHLSLKPLHHDEGVNGWFILRILDEHVYKYNPKNYHGPLLYFLNTLPVIFAGRTVEALRFMPALFGTLSIPAMALFRRQLGWFGVLVAATFVAVAPIEVYFSRTAIHEIYNFIFNLTLVGGIAAWAVWKQRKHLILAGLSLSCLFATKETTVITLAAMGPALLMALAYGRGPLPFTRDRFVTGWPVARTRAVYAYLLEHYRADRKAFTAAGMAFLVVWVLLFSSLFTNPIGLGSFFAAFFAWGDTGTAGKGHQKPWSYFFTHLLWPYYRPLLLWGGLGLVWSSIRRERLALFSIVWWVLTLVAYSVIPYKTPWCVLSFSGPLFIGIGLLMKEAIQVLRGGRIFARMAAVVAIAIPIALLVPYAVPMGPEYEELLQPPRGKADLAVRIQDLPRSAARVLLPGSDSWTINSQEYDVKGHPFIYVQNVREYLDLVNDLHGLIETAQLDGNEELPRILMIDAKNPMRWYLQKTGKQTWRGKFDDEARAKMPKEVDIVCTSAQYSKDVEKLLGTEFEKRRYHERPGRKIDLFVRKPLWEAYESAAKEGVALSISPPFKPKSYSDRTTADMKNAWSRRGMN